MEKLEVMITALEIEEKVRQLAARITEDFGGKPVVAVCVLKGAIVFAADLIRGIDLPLSLEFMTLSSYRDNDVSSGVVEVVQRYDFELAGKNVLVIEDIVDTGETLSFLLGDISRQRPETLKLCALLSKQSRRATEVRLDYVGFEIPDEFVVGYGLDYAQKYRNLPYIAKIIG